MADSAELRVFPFDNPVSPETDQEMARLRIEESMARVRLRSGVEVWLATRYEDAKQVFTDPRFSRAAGSRPDSPTVIPGTQVPEMMTSLDPPDHTRVRRLVAHAFTPRRVERLRPRVQQLVDGQLDRMAAQGPPADIVGDFAWPVPLTVICEMLGVPYSDRYRFTGWIDILLSAGSHTPDELRTAFREMDGYIRELIAVKRARPADDLLSGMIEARDEGNKLTEDEVLLNTRMLLVAGQDTTANQLTNSVLALLGHPDQLALVRDRPELMPAAVEELFRYLPLVPYGALGRTAVADVEIGGVVIRAGETVFAIMHSANRDTDVYPDADRLEVTRIQPAPHLGLGHGMHFCLGAPLARMELAVGLGSLFGRFPDLSLAVPEADLEWKQGHAMRSLLALPVTW